MKNSRYTKISTRFLVGTIMLMFSLISVGQVWSAVVLIDSDDIASLTLMREEEKLARDVYKLLYEKWGVPIFDNISKSEQTHMDAILTLLNRYGIDDPVEGLDVGEFKNQVMEDLYDKLTTNGTATLIEALKVGVDIEKMDILDLENGINATTLRDIKRVYTNLLNGSKITLTPSFPISKRWELFTNNQLYQITG